MKSKFTKKKIITLISIALFLTVFCLINNLWLVITKYDISNPDLPEQFDNYRIVQISDLHNSCLGNTCIPKIKALQPDCIVITGDIIDAYHTNLQTAITFCEQASAICPVYYITGNHEVWLSAEEQETLFTGIQNAGVHILNHEIIEISRNQEKIFLCGLDDNHLTDPTLKTLTEHRNTEEFLLLLAHEPQYFKEYCQYSPDLILSGHAHGGQFRIPFTEISLIAPDQGFFPAYTAGVFTENDSTMIISRGIGNSVIPVRICNLPEIVLVTLHQ